jgi:hypothetical protein
MSSPIASQPRLPYIVLSLLSNQLLSPPALSLPLPPHARPSTHRSSHDIADFITPAVHRAQRTLQQNQTLPPRNRVKASCPPWRATTTSTAVTAIVTTTSHRAQLQVLAPAHDTGRLPTQSTTHPVSTLCTAPALPHRSHIRLVHHQHSAYQATWTACSTTPTPKSPRQHH